jgi:general secretion pathway protein G
MTQTREKTATGYTLLELMIVVAIASILVTLAVPSFQRSAVKAREATLKNNLATIRTVLDQHYADQGIYPQSLEALVEAGYLRHVPIDPMTKAADTWQLVFEEGAGDADAGGVFDIHSGSEEVSISGTAYNEW